MKRRRLASIAVLSAVLQFALGSGNALGLVLCSNADGHVAIESSLRSACCDDVDSAPSFGGTAADDCRGCTDTPLLQNSIELRSKSASALPALRSILLPALVPADCRRPLRDRSLREPSSARPQQALLSRRSIVLVV
jgi:hypothetical protein